MTPDLAPFVVGKVLGAEEAKVSAVVLRREDGAWSSAPEPLDAEGAFAVQVSLLPRKASAFRVEGVAQSGKSLALAPPTFTIVHGVTIQDPPLSRSIGVALANDGVQVYFERGSPLPMRRTFTLRTVETVSRGADGFAIRVPVVQGEFALAHLCRLVGALEIPSSGVKATLPAGSAVEVTLELDRGGRLSATARVPSRLVCRNAARSRALINPAACTTASAPVTSRSSAPASSRLPGMMSRSIPGHASWRPPRRERTRMRTPSPANAVIRCIPRKPVAPVTATTGAEVTPRRRPRARRRRVGRRRRPDTSSARGCG